MSVRRWVGVAAAVAQVDKYTPANVAIGNTFTLTATGQDGSTVAITYTAAAATVADVTAGLSALWNLSTHPLCTGITAADVTTYLTLTADTAGVPILVASTASGGTATLTEAAVTASSGPNDYNIVANWVDENGTTAAAIPTNADSVYFENTDIDCLYGLNQSGITLTLLEIGQTYTGLIGQADAPLKTGCTTVNIGQYQGTSTPAGSGRINLDLVSAASTVNVYNSATTAEDSYQLPIRITNTVGGTGTALNVKRGRVGVCSYSSTETAKLTTVNIGYQLSVDTDSYVVLGAGTTIGTSLTMTGGTAYLNSTCATITMDGGTLYIAGAGTTTTLTLNSGTLYSSGTGTITTLNGYGGTADFTLNNTARTVTTYAMKTPNVLRYDPSVVTFTNKVAPSGRVQLTCAALQGDIMAHGHGQRAPKYRAGRTILSADRLNTANDKLTRTSRDVYVADIKQPESDIYTPFYAEITQALTYEVTVDGEEQERYIYGWVAKQWNIDTWSWDSDWWRQGTYENADGKKTWYCPAFHPTNGILVAGARVWLKGTQVRGSGSIIPGVTFTGSWYTVMQASSTSFWGKIISCSNIRLPGQETVYSGEYATVRPCTGEYPNLVEATGTGSDVYAIRVKNTWHGVGDFVFCTSSGAGVTPEYTIVDKIPLDLQVKPNNDADITIHYDDGNQMSNVQDDPTDDETHCAGDQLMLLHNVIEFLRTYAFPFRDEGILKWRMKHCWRTDEQWWAAEVVEAEYEEQFLDGFAGSGGLAEPPYYAMKTEAVDDEEFTMSGTGDLVPVEGVNTITAFKLLLEEPDYRVVLPLFPLTITALVYPILDAVSTNWVEYVLYMGMTATELDTEEATHKATLRVTENSGCYDLDFWIHGNDGVGGWTELDHPVSYFGCEYEYLTMIFAFDGNNAVQFIVREGAGAGWEVYNSNMVTAGTLRGPGMALATKTSAANITDHPKITSYQLDYWTPGLDVVSNIGPAEVFSNIRYARLTTQDEKLCIRGHANMGDFNLTQGDPPTAIDPKVIGYMVHGEHEDYRDKNDTDPEDDPHTNLRARVITWCDPCYPVCWTCTDGVAGHLRSSEYSRNDLNTELELDFVVTGYAGCCASLNHTQILAACNPNECIYNPIPQRVACPEIDFDWYDSARTLASWYTKTCDTFLSVGCPVLGNPDNGEMDATVDVFCYSSQADPVDHPVKAHMQVGMSMSTWCNDPGDEDTCCTYGNVIPENETHCRVFGNCIEIDWEDMCDIWGPGGAGYSLALECYYTSGPNLCDNSATVKPHEEPS